MCFVCADYLYVNVYGRSECVALKFELVQCFSGV